MNNIALREAVLDDAALVLEIERAAFGEYGARLDPPSGVFRETVEAVREKMALGTFLLALHEHEPVGVVFYQRFETHVYLGRLAVLPAYQRHGIGGALIGEVERRARELGAGRVRLGVRIALPHLRARYERLGYQFVEAHSHPGYSVPTWVTMEKELETGAGETRRQGDKEAKEY